MDLNIIIQDCGIRDSKEIIEQKLVRCKTLGFHTIAIAVIIDIDNNSPPVVPTAPNLRELVTPSGLQVYTRLTAKVGESLQLHRLGKCKETSKYNLIALEPQNVKILQYISTGNADLDILTFNLSDRLEYNLLRIGYRVLEDRGVCTEINYGPAQMGSSLRRNIICNGQNLIEKTVKNIILSSGLADEFRLRGPKDAKCLGVLFMMPNDKCHDAVHKNGFKAINLAKHRVNPASSAIELIKITKSSSRENK